MMTYLIRRGNLFGWLADQRAHNPVFRHETTLTGPLHRRLLELVFQVVIVAIFLLPLAYQTVLEVLATGGSPAGAAPVFQGRVLSLFLLVTGCYAFTLILILPLTIVFNSLKLFHWGWIHELMHTSQSERDFLRGMITGNFLFILILSTCFAGLFLHGFTNPVAQGMLPEGDSLLLSRGVLWTAYCAVILGSTLITSWMLGHVALWVSLRIRLNVIAATFVIIALAFIVFLPLAVSMAFEAFRMHWPDVNREATKSYVMFVSFNLLVAAVYLSIGFFTRSILIERLYDYFRRWEESI